MRLRFVEKEPEVSGVYSFLFEPDLPAGQAGKKISWQPGQYLHYELPHPHSDDRGIERWFTISAAPFEQHIMLTTRFDGERQSTFKQALFMLEPGTEVEAGEPRGEFLLDTDAARHILIAGGIGITPYRSQLLQLDHDGKQLNADIMYANRDKNFVFGEQLAELEKKHPEFKIIKFVGDHRITPKDVEQYLPDEKVIFYLSGPRPLVENYQHMLEELDVNPNRIRTDYFPGY